MSDSRPRTPLGRPRGDEESRILTYVVPFAAAVLVAVGIGWTILGGWAVVQPAVDGCGNPLISVSSPEDTADRVRNETADAGPEHRRIDVDELTPAERRAFEEAVESPRGEGIVAGAFDHRDAFERGVVISRDGTERYVTVVSMNQCLAVNPLVLPLGIISLSIGLAAFAYLWYRFTPTVSPG